jgi:hypothetical protein
MRLLLNRGVITKKIIQVYYEFDKNMDVLVIHQLPPPARVPSSLKKKSVLHEEKAKV